MAAPALRWEAIAQQLFAVPHLKTYAILDGASVPQLPQTLARFEAEAECLFRGELEPDMAQVAPYLVPLQLDDPFTDWLLHQGWGQHWGIYALSSVDLRPLRMHLRTFLKVYGPDLKPLYFRYYDPRVLRTYLPTGNAQELQTVFGPVHSYLLEDQDPNTLLKFTLDGAELRREAVQLAEPDPAPEARS